MILSPTTNHSVKFERNTRSGDWRAKCTCGWFHIGERDEVQSRAATHDLEWEAVEPATLNRAMQGV